MTKWRCVDAGRLLAPMAAALLSCAEPSTAPSPPADEVAATWTTWLLGRTDVLRPGAPPADGSPQATQELDEIVTLQRNRTATTDSLVRRHSGDPVELWSRTAVDLLGFYWTLLPDVRLATPARSARLMALLHVATQDAVLATWEAKYAYKRRAPWQVDSRVRTLMTSGDVPSYPDEHAAVAAAAREVLAAHFLPGDTTRLRTLMRETGDARIVAGAAHRSDIDAGYTLGLAVGRRVLQHAMADGSDRVWTGSIPAVSWAWKPTPVRFVSVPFDAMAGTWKTWVIPSGDAFRPPPFPVVGSPRFDASLDELRRLSAGGRTVTQMDRARYWATEAPTARWELFMEEELTRRRWSTPRAARARAWLSVAMYDAFVACWDAKYHYWLARPVTINRTLTTVFSTPPFPSYPSGHSTVSTAAAQVLSEFFADRAREWEEKATEASNSRVWGGVHYRFDIEAGDTLGRRVGERVVTRMRAEGVR